MSNETQAVMQMKLEKKARRNERAEPSLEVKPLCKKISFRQNEQINKDVWHVELHYIDRKITNSIEHKPNAKTNKPHMRKRIICLF